MYTQLSQWHAAHGAAGSLSILCYPSDEFGQQELPAAEIPGFVAQYLPLDTDRVHLMAKCEVNGPNADPVWTALKAAFPGDVEVRRSRGRDQLGSLANGVRHRTLHGNLP